MGIKTDPYNNTNEKKNSSKTYQLNKSDEEKESINMQNKNNIINIFFKDKKKGKESKEKEKNNKIKKRSVEKISDDVKKKEKKILYDMYDEEKKKDKVNEKNSEDSNRSYDEVDIFNEVVNEQIKHKAEVEVEEEEEEEEEKVEKNFVASENCYEEDENISRKSKEDEECTEEEERIVVNEKVKREQEKEKNKEKHKKEKRKNNKGKNKEKLKKEKTKKNKEKWKREKMESFLSLSKFSNIFNKSTENILEKNNGECKGKNEKNESKFPNLNNTKITKKKLDSNTDKDYSNNKNTNINLTNFTSYIKKNNSIHQTFLTKNVKEKMEENKMKSNDNFVENLKFKKLKLNVLKPFRNKDFKIKDDPLKDTSGFSQKFRYSFFKIKNKFKQNFNTSENKIIQDKKTMENDKIMLNSFNKNKNGKVSEENSSTLMDSNYNDYRKKYTKELCILINFSYNNMFDIFNYPDDYMEKKKKKFSLIHKIFYSLNIFFNSFSTLIKQRYFFSCTNELTKFLKISLFFNYDCEFIYKTNNQNNTEYNLFRTFNKSCSICGSKLKYFNDCYCISYKETDPLINRIYNEKNGFINNSNNSNIENGIYNAYNSGYKDSENYNKNTFNYNSLNHSNNNSRCYHKIYNKSSDPFNWISTKCNNSNNIENDYSSICCNCDKNMNRKFCNTNKNDENNSNHAFYKNNSILYDNYCLTDISDKLNSIRNRKKNNKTYNLSKKINSIVKNSENYFNFINENNLYINDYLIKNKKKEKRKIYYDKNNEKNLNILCSNSTNEDNFNNSNLLLTDESNINDINIRYITNIIYGTNFQNKLKVHLNIEKLHEKWKIYFKENKSHLNIQDYFLFNLSFIYNLYNYLILIYICTYFSEESYFNFCNNQKFYQFIKKVHSYNKKKEHNWNTRHICDASIIPNFLDFTDYKLLKVFFFLLQNSSNKFISKNIEYFNFPIVFIFCSDAKNFNFNHFDIIKISKNNNIIYLLYKRGNEGLFLSGLKPFIWIHKVLFDFVESMFLSSYDK